VPGHGTGIFVHVKGAGSTAGCVSVDSANLVGIMRWLDPAKSPRIVMAPTGWLAQA
jgi:L,D-peptidoglycan transpeptidase YkuD (ErfK/YbiS/YcfS/YnhG family)